MHRYTNEIVSKQGGENFSSLFLRNLAGSLFHKNQQRMRYTQDFQKEENKKIKSDTRLFSLLC